MARHKMGQKGEEDGVNVSSFFTQSQCCVTQ